MKSYLSVVLLGVIALTVMSCGDNDDGWDFPLSPYEMSEFDLVVGLFALGDCVNPQVLSHVEPQEWELKINGQDIEILGWEYHSEYGSWIADIDNAELAGIDFSSGETVQYFYSVNDQTIDGEMTIPERPVVEWSENFDFNEDYEIEWTIAEQPQTYIVGMWMESNEIGYQRTDWQVSRHKEKFNIPKKNFQEYENEEDLVIGFEVIPVNFVVEGKDLAYFRVHERKMYFNHRHGSMEDYSDHPKNAWHILEMFKRMLNK
jgi:hypothetical protein